MSEKRIPSKVVSALLRLERAGDEHSRTTQRLCNAAWLVADLLRQQWVEHVSARAGRHDNTVAYVREDITLDERGVMIWAGRDDGEVIAPDGNPNPPTRWAAIRLAEAVAAGWTDELTSWMATRIADDRKATAVLDAAAERLQPDERPVPLRERGVYLLPCGGEAIACRQVKDGNPAGWLLYTPAQWRAEAPAEYQSDLDGVTVSRWGYECPWILADLEDTGRTMDPETDRLAD